MTVAGIAGAVGGATLGYVLMCLWWNQKVFAYRLAIIENISAFVKASDYTEDSTPLYRAKNAVSYFGMMWRPWIPLRKHYEGSILDAEGLLP